MAFGASKEEAIGPVGIYTGRLTVFRDALKTLKLREGETFWKSTSPQTVA